MESKLKRPLPDPGGIIKRLLLLSPSFNAFLQSSTLLTGVIVPVITILHASSVQVHLDKVLDTLWGGRPCIVSEEPETRGGAGVFSHGFK